MAEEGNEEDDEDEEDKVVQVKRAKREIEGKPRRRPKESEGRERW